jgi:hypothetical protein
MDPRRLQDAVEILPGRGREGNPREGVMKMRGRKR